MSIKSFLSRITVCRTAYHKIKEYVRERRSFKYHGLFINRSKGKDYLCIVLAGYKEFLYEAFFDRLKSYLIDEIDVCICSSGLYSAGIEKMCKDNNWSYLSTNENQVSLVQNVAIKMHPEAKMIFKLDEDVFITKNYFDKMIKAYKHAKNGDYCPGVIAPLLLINGYSSLRIIDKLSLREEYEKRFGKLLYATGPDTVVEANPEFAKFMWGEGGFVPSIDILNNRFSEEPVRELPCPYRFSIGAILFSRKLWIDMGYFSVDMSSSGMGMDEEQLGEFCFIKSRPIMVSENIVVGHLSFGNQNKEMKKYYASNKTKFVKEN